MYLPKSQIIPDLYTNGGEYILSTTKQDYVGYYYQTSNGTSYTGKNPQYGNNILLLKSNKLETQNESGVFDPKGIEIIPTLEYSTNTPNRFLPQFNPTLPTPQDISLGVFSRYFCKKNNELVYLETDKQTFTDLSSRSPKIAWDLYTPLTTVWYIKGDKETTYKANKGLVSVIEQRQQWYGFSKYLKEDFLKYYVGE